MLVNPPASSHTVSNRDAYDSDGNRCYVKGRQSSFRSLHEAYDSEIGSETEDESHSDVQEHPADDSYKRLVRLIIRQLPINVAPVDFLLSVLRKRKIALPPGLDLHTVVVKSDWAVIIGGTLQQMSMLRKVLKNAGVDIDWIQSLTTSPASTFPKDISREIRGFLPKDSGTKTLSKLRKLIAQEVDLRPSTDFYNDTTGFFSFGLKKAADIEKLLNRTFHVNDQQINLMRRNFIKVSHPYLMVIKETLGASKKALDAACELFGECKTTVDQDGLFFVTFDDYNAATEARRLWSLRVPTAVAALPPPVFVIDRNTATNARPLRAAASGKTDKGAKPLEVRDQRILATMEDRLRPFEQKLEDLGDDTKALGQVLSPLKDSLIAQRDICSSLLRIIARLEVRTTGLAKSPASELNENNSEC